MFASEEAGLSVKLKWAKYKENGKPFSS